MCSGLCGWRVRRRQTWAGSSSPSKAGQRREAQVVSGRSRSPSRLGSSGRGEGQEGDSGAAERRSRVDPAEADRQAPGHRVHVQRSRDRAGQHGGLVQGTQAGGHPQLPLARPAAHVGKLARAGRNSAARAAGVGRLGELRHGPAVRALGSRAPGAVGRATQCSVGRWHKCGTTAGRKSRA